MNSIQKYSTLIASSFLLSCGEPEPCSKVDFLMVIDNSGSMQGYQSKLSQEFSTMITEINKIEDIEDYRIGVVTTDAYAFNHEGCRNVGDLVTQTPKEKSLDFLTALQQIFTNSSDQIKPDDVSVCLDDPNKPWLAKGDADIEKKFQCLIEVGALGDGNERPLEALRNSMTASCNKGFYRQDAMLVAMIVTDEDDNTAFGPAIYQDILTSRNDLPNQMVVLPIINSSAPNLRDFASLFANHYEGSIGSSEYTSILKTGAKKLEHACNNFGNECPTDQCCMPTDWAKLIIGFGAPPILGIIAGFLLGQGFAKKAVQQKRFTDGPTTFGYLLGGLLATTSAAIIWSQFCVNCIASNALYEIIGLGAIATILGFIWFSKKQA